MVILFQVFDVSLNGVRVIENLDIFDKVGKGVAHDEYVSFTIRDNVFVYNNIESSINNGKIKVEFLKVSRQYHQDTPRFVSVSKLYFIFLQGRKDNPKINAIIVYRGNIHGEYESRTYSPSHVNSHCF